MLLLPATVTAKEANDTQRLLTQALKGEAQADVVVDASNLQHFDSAALAVLLECERAAEGFGKSFALRNAPPKLAALARLYGVDALLMPEPTAG
ncbi:MAG TPA: STAS domain-containing protein [Burkholderiaceae bacterium]|nr:STAS domain-containing protein [Burkholderiaceae bacterium]